MGGGAFNSKLDNLNLVLKEVSRIPRRPALWKKRIDNRHCLVIRCHEDLEDILSVPTNGLVIQVSLKHGLTGLSEVFEYEYGNSNDIKKGKFKPGTKIEIN